MSDLDMLKILKGFDTIEKKSVITESAVTECGMMPQESASNVNISVTGNSMADIMRALANIESGSPTMAMSMDSMEAEEEAFEDWANEPDEEYQDHEYMTKTISGGLNREKKMYKPAAAGDNPMAIESIKDRLYRELNEKKAKPDYLDMDKDGNKKEPMKKAVADKKKKAPVKESSEELEEAITNWKGEEVDPQVGDIVRLYGGGHRPIKGVIVGPGNGRFEGSFAIKFKNLRGDIVVDSFYAKDEFEIIQKASTNEAKKTKPDFLDMDKDGNKKEPMKKAVADKKKAPFKK
jgi:hypothetical protein